MTTHSPLAGADHFGLTAWNMERMRDPHGDPHCDCAATVRVMRTVTQSVLAILNRLRSSKVTVRFSGAEGEGAQRFLREFGPAIQDAFTDRLKDRLQGYLAQTGRELREMRAASHARCSLLFAIAEHLEPANQDDDYAAIANEAERLADDLRVEGHNVVPSFSYPNDELSSLPRLTANLPTFELQQAGRRLVECVAMDLARVDDEADLLSEFVEAYVAAMDDLELDDPDAPCVEFVTELHQRIPRSRKVLDLFLRLQGQQLDSIERTPGDEHERSACLSANRLWTVATGSDALNENEQRHLDVCERCRHYWSRIQEALGHDRHDQELS
ncbi:MAG: hypothetical protein V1926_05935 [Candidatus Peregrinibacteria bacterium]